MRNLKKFLALVMAMVMAFSLMLTASAKDVVKDWTDKSQVTEEFTEAVDVLSGMDVFQGDPGGTFRPGDNITRAEVAALIYRLATDDTGTEKMDLYTTTHPFTDVGASDWFAGYVGFCWNAGYIKGTTATTFNPYDNVTGYEVLAMILRAMGYDANNEFTGTNWIVNVSATAQQRGLLADIKSTHYANTLHLASRRDVVASILFQAAQADRVKYTPAFGYQSGDYNVVDKVEPGRYDDYTPLGVLNFGLDHETSIILGNQATGENCTLLGVNKTTYKDDNGAEHTANTEYAYPGSTVNKNWVTPAAKADFTVPTGTKLDGELGKTGLDLFGHKVKAWYDNRDLNKDGKMNTYAILDKASLSALVHTDDTANANYNYTLSATDATKAQAKLGIAAQKAGFSVNLGTNGSTAFYSDTFSRILGDVNTGTTAPALNNTVDSRIAKLPSDMSKNDMYVLVSNNGDKKVDVIIAVNADVALIAQKNTTGVDKSLKLSDYTSTLAPKSRFDNSDGVIHMDGVVEGSATNLGDKVAAWQVKGTNNKSIYTADDWAKGKKGTYSNDNTTDNLYYLDKLEKVTTGTILTYGAKNEITLTDGTVIEQSWFRYGYAANDTTDLVTGPTTNDFVVGHDGSTTETFKVPANWEVGVTYNIALDNTGRWLGVTATGKEFLYGTFGDFSVGNLGTGTSEYAITGVNWDGEKVINNPFTNYTHSDSTKHPSATTTLGEGYSKLAITKKSYNTASSGNQILAGANTGYMVDGEGNVDATNLAARLATGGTYGVAGSKWSITAQDAANGYADVYKTAWVSDGRLLLTNDTKFIVVSGNGSSNLDVKTYTGLTELLNGSSAVDINLATPTYGATGAHSSGAWGNTYYLTGADTFNRVDTSENKLVTHVILDARDLAYTGVNNLYFAGSKTETGVKLAGANANTEQYVVYRNGEKETVFVDSSIYGAGNVPEYAYGASNFFELVEAYQVNGVPVYSSLRTGKDSWGTGNDVPTSICNTSLQYHYVGVNNMATAIFNGGWGTGAAFNKIMDVSNAKVVDVEYDSVTCNHEKLDSVEKLNQYMSGNNVAGSSTVNVQVAIVYEGINVSTIYVWSVGNCTNNYYAT